MKKSLAKKMKPVIEGLKQLGRVFLVAVVPLLIDQLTRDTINWRAISITGVIAVLMAVDKFLHEEGKAIGSEALTKGLTRF